MAEKNKLEDDDLSMYEVTPQEDDLSMYEVSSAPSAESEKPSQLEAILQGMSQGATAGFGEEAVAAGAAPIESIRRLVSQYLPGTPENVDKMLAEKGFNIDQASLNPLDTYKDIRDTARKAQDVAREEHPYTYGTSEVLGGMLPAVASGGATAIPSATKGAGQVALKELLKQGAKQGAKAGLIGGVASGLGESKADLTEGEFVDALGDTAKAGAIGAAGGGVLGSGGAVIGKGLGKIGDSAEKFVDHIKDQYPSMGRIISAAQLSSKGEKFLGERQQAVLLQDMSDTIQEMNDKGLRKLVDKYGSMIGNIERKAQGSVDVTDDLLKLERNLRKEMEAATTDEAEKTLGRMADRIKKQFTVEKVEVPGDELAMQKAIEKRGAIMQDAEAKASLTKAPNISRVYADSKNKIVYYKDNNSGAVKTMKYDFDESYVDEFADEATKMARAETIRARVVQDKAQKLELANDKLHPQEQIKDVYAEADKLISKPSFDDETKRFVVYDLETGKPAQYTPKYVTKDEAIQLLKQDRAITQKTAKMKYEKAQQPMQLSEPEIQEDLRRVVFRNLETGQTYKVPIPKGKLGEEIITGRVKLTADDLNNLARGIGSKKDDYFKAGVGREAMEVFKFYKDKAREAISDPLAIKELDHWNKKYSMLKQAIDIMKPNLMSNDFVDRKLAEKELANLADNLMDSTNLSTRRSFNQFFDAMNKLDPNFVKDYKPRISALAEKIDLNVAALGSSATQSTNIGRLAGAIESVGIHGGALGGRIARTVQDITTAVTDRAINMPKEGLLRSADTAMQKYGKNGERVANILRDLANSPKQRRSALLFSAMQSPAYRNMIMESLSEGEVNE